MTLAPCPCGKVPSKIFVDVIYESKPGVFAHELSGDCCGKWFFHHKSSKVEWPKPYLAKRWWNSAPRGKGEE